MPGDVACNAKILAYEFAVSVQPERDAAGLAVIASGMYSTLPLTRRSSVQWTLPHCMGVVLLPVHMGFLIMLCYATRFPLPL